MAKKEAPQFEPVLEPDYFGPTPEGLDEVSSGNRLVGWFMIQAGNAIRGILRGSFEVDSRFKRKGEENKKKRVYKIEVTDPKAGTKDGTLYTPSDSAIAEDWPDGKPAEVGDLIGLDEKGFLQSLRDIPEGTEVWAGCYGKEPPSETYPQGAWKFKVLAKLTVDEDKEKSAQE